jgi:hypothetical protein
MPRDPAELAVEAPFTDEEWAFLEACGSNPPRNALRKLQEIQDARAARTRELRRKVAEERR